MKSPLPLRSIEAAFPAVLSIIIAVTAVAPKFLAFSVPLAGLIFFILNGAQTKQWKLDKRIIVPLTIIGGLALLSSLWAIHPSDAVTRAGRLIGILVGGAGLITYAILHPPRRVSGNQENGERTKEGGNSIAIPLAVLFLAAFMALELILDFPIYHLLHPSKAGERISDAVANRSIVTATLLAVPAFALAQIKWGWKKAALFFVPIFGAMFAVSESQSAQMGLIVALATTFFFPYRWKGAWVALGTIVTVLTLSAPFIAPVLFQDFAQKAQALPEIGNGSANIEPRLEIWDFVSRYAMKRPLQGFGIEATRDIQDFDTQQLYFKNNVVLHPHNAVLQIWIEFGMIGAVLASVGFCLLLRQIYKNCTTAQARIALPVLMAALSIGAMSYGLWQGWWIGLLFLSTAVTLIAIKEHSLAT